MGGCESIEPATVALHGSRCCGVCRKKVLTKRYCVTQWQPICSIQWGFTLAREAGSSSARVTKEGPGTRYLTDCRPWSAFGAPSSKILLTFQGPRRRSPRPCHPVNRSLDRRPRRVGRRGDACRSRFTFRVLCANLRLD